MAFVYELVCLLYIPDSLVIDLVSVSSRSDGAADFTLWPADFLAMNSLQCEIPQK